MMTLTLHLARRPKQEHRRRQARVPSVRFDPLVMPSVLSIFHARGRPTAVGQKRTNHRRLKSTFVRCYSNSGQTLVWLECPLSAKSGLMQCSKQHLYSITSSARESSDGGTVRPIAFAVLRLMTNSNLVGCSTGRSPGLAPLKILSIRPADRL